MYVSGISSIIQWIWYKLKSVMENFLTFCIFYVLYLKIINKYTRHSIVSFFSKSSTKFNTFFSKLLNLVLLFAGIRKYSWRRNRVGWGFFFLSCWIWYYSLPESVNKVVGKPGGLGVFFSFVLNLVLLFSGNRK